MSESNHEIIVAELAKSEEYLRDLLTRLNAQKAEIHTLEMVLKAIAHLKIAVPDDSINSAASERLIAATAFRGGIGAARIAQ